MPRKQIAITFFLLIATVPVHFFIRKEMITKAQIACAEKKTTPKKEAEGQIKAMPAGSEIYAALPSVVLEIQFVTSTGRFLAIREPGQPSFSTYQGKKSRLSEVQSAQVASKAAAWLESLKIVKEVEGDDDELGGLMETPQSAFLLIRTSGPGTPKIITVGKRTASGDYFISLLDQRVYQVRGDVLDLLMAHSAPGGSL